MKSQFTDNTGRRKKVMRKLVCLSLIVALFVSMTVVFAYAQAQTKLTKDKAGVLKGVWQGNMDFGNNLTCLLVLTIENDTVPLKGKLSMQNIPAGRADLFPGGFSGNTYEGPFDNGLITNKGTLIISGQGGNFGEWTLKGDKLSGWFYLWGSQGTMSLKKK
jgi:hypothetical protein